MRGKRAADVVCFDARHRDIAAVLNHMRQRSTELEMVVCAGVSNEGEVVMAYGGRLGNDVYVAIGALESLKRWLPDQEDES